MIGPLKCKVRFNIRLMSDYMIFQQNTVAPEQITGISSNFPGLQRCLHFSQRDHGGSGLTFIKELSKAIA